MTYLGFHLAFNLPLLAVLFLVSGRGIWPQEMVLVMVGILGIVMTFTSPYCNKCSDRAVRWSSLMLP